MRKLRYSVSRRTALGGLAGIAAFWRLPDLAAEGLGPRVAEVVRTTIGVDAHNHIDVPLATAEIPGPNLDIAGDMKRSGLSAVCSTFAVDYQAITDPADGYGRFVAGLTAFDVQLARNAIKRSLNLADILAAQAAGQPTVIQGVEGAHFLEGKLERVAYAYERGLRHFGLLHDHDATPPLGDVFTNAEIYGGLTELGAATILECERLGILVDLSHGSAKTVRAALGVATKPLIVSHTGLNTLLGEDPRFAAMMRPRLIDRELASEIADAGGVIGVWTHLARSPAEYARNIRSMVDVVGIDHVCIGTDSKLTGAAASGSQGTNNQWSGQTKGFYFVVVEALLSAGFTAEEIGKIGGANYLRIFDAATRSA